ncbi:MAG: NmrA/HSCARG family protein [Chitinophagaceae bacterium]
MPADKTIFVTGATGSQGGSVVRNLLQQGFAVKALTRNKNAAKAEALLRLQVDLVQGNLDDPTSYSDHLKEVDGVFSVIDYKQGPARETRQGIDLADSAKENGVKHFLYSSVIGADANTGVPHWESKFKIETHIKQTGLPYTIIRPASLYENFLIPQVKSRLLKGKLVSPSHKNKVQQYISAEDVGRISTIIFMNPGKYKGQSITIAAEQMDSLQVADVFSKVWGKPVSYQQLPGIITRLAMGKNLYKMFKWINEHDALFIKDLAAVKNEFPGMLSLEEWIQRFYK